MKEIVDELIKELDNLEIEQLIATGIKVALLRAEEDNKELQRLTKEILARIEKKAKEA